MKRFSQSALAGILILAVTSFPSALMADMFEETVTNITGMQTITPILVATHKPGVTSNASDWESRLCQGFRAINAYFRDNWGQVEWNRDYSRLAVMVYKPTIGSGPPNSNKEIYVVSVPDTRAPVNVTAYPGPDRNPAWSPDGKKLAFTRDFDDEIFVVDANGNNLLNLGARGSSLSWSPDGSKIAFVDPTLRLSLVSSNGDGPRMITHGTVADDHPAWSPNGRWIAFVRGNRNDDRNDLYIVNADGRNEHLLSRANARTSPLWSPDGSSLAFAGRDLQIVIVQPSNVQTRQVTTDPPGGSPVAWSPDGRKIAYLTKNPNGAGQLNVVDVKTGTVRTVCAVAY